MDRKTKQVWKTRLLFLLIALCLSGLPFSAASAAATEADIAFRANLDQINLGGAITIRQTAKALGHTITLGDIATLTGDGAEALASFPIACFADQANEKDHQTVTIRTSEVRRLLTALGVNWARMDLRGFHHCTVSLNRPTEVQVEKDVTDDAKPRNQEETRPAAPEDPQLVVARLREMVDLLGADRPGRWTIELTSDDRAWVAQLPGGTQDFLEIEPITTTIPGRVIVMLRRFEGRDLAEQRRIAVQVTHHLAVVVAAGNLARNQPIDESSVRLEEMEFDAPISPPFLAVEDAVGQVPTMNLRSGAVLSKLTTRPPLAVSRGDDVTVQSRMGSVSISMRGRAMEEGRVGDVIRIQNPINRSVVHARLIAPRLARVGDD